MGAKIIILGGVDRTASVRVSSSTTAACHAASRCATTARDHHGQLQPRDRVDRLDTSDRLYFEPLVLKRARHLRP